MPEVVALLIGFPVVLAGRWLVEHRRLNRGGFLN